MRGIVVENLETGNWYARSEQNLDANTERKVRDLNPGETIIGFRHKNPTSPAAPSSAPENDEQEGRD